MSQLDRIPDYYGDGAWYDAEYVHIGGDIPYYEQVARETQGELLELACGTGRLTFPMAATETKVHGIDLAASMVDRARHKWRALGPVDRSNLSFVVGDMRSYRVDRKFEAVVLAFNTLMHLTEDRDLLATLDTVKAHLAPDGLFHFDLHTPFPELLSRESEGRYDPQEMVAPDGSRYVVTENNSYDPRRQINRMRFFYQQVDKGGARIGNERYAELELRVLFPRELDLILDFAGFEVLGDWDGFDRKLPFQGTGGRRVLCCRTKR